MLHTPLLFLHANGFPTGSYRQFLQALQALMPNASIHSVPVIDTPRTLAGALRWSTMTDSVEAEIRRIADSEGPLALVGHSMGGYLALLASQRATDSVSGIVLIDTPVVTGWRSPFFEVVKYTGLSQTRGPAPIAARRRDHWPTAAEARAHFADKPFARRWAPEVLEDYLSHGLTDISHHPEHGAGKTLRIARETERDIYAHLPARQTLHAYRALRRTGMPVWAVAGRFSRETRLAGRANNRRLFGERWQELATGHLVPMEAPQDCAQAVAACVTTWQDQPGHRNPADGRRDHDIRAA